MARSRSSHPRVLFAPAAGAGIGGGHVMRCITLSQALSRRDAACAFSVGDAGAALLARFADQAFDVIDGPPAAALAAGRFDAVVIDDYAVAATTERALGGRAAEVVVIDDLANRPHAADLLIDPSYSRRAADYDDLLPQAAKRLIGPAFALVRPAFAALRQTALQHPIPPAPQRAFVSFGLSDVDGIAARAVALIRARHPALPLDIALASDAQSLGVLRARAATDPHLHLHIDATTTAALMAAADVAIGAGGASTWERACLGLPTLAVIVADNQRASIQAMAADGAVLAVDLHVSNFEVAFDAALARLYAQGVRTALRDRSAALCDGGGAERIADAILAL